ncbi:MAG: tetraacyldisaccharide 4'-kinase [Desulfobulbaceae bacterium]|uniref:Tetraacyldisaccharide 4'-kinase n=1 Tax=Candidatus Desulfatifera sulfidica TaxID=2841691 RepID=A0A8J6N9Y7_9BACT|nr:tetraacyldisaccharide 4'-kinase [Candidatus Desulfatifera sulfidica]
MINNKNLLFSLGRPFSPLYSWIMKLRAAFYKKEVLRSTRMETPVISVGNLTMGGTGKTPLVCYLAKLLRNQGLRPAIISRGYGGSTKNRVNVVSNGKDLFLDANEAGDEPRLLAELLPGVPVLTGIVRALPCRHAVMEFDCNVLILDDGFQHLGVQRDIDLVLFHGDELAGNSRIFPGGDLREPVSALERATAFVLTNITPENNERNQRFAHLLKERFPQKPVFFICTSTQFFRTQESATPVSVTELPQPLHGFCGIGKPDTFHHDLTAKGLDICSFTSYKDHQTYPPKLLNAISQTALQQGARGLVTTEKDLVKIGNSPLPLPLFALQLQITPEPQLDQFVLDHLKSLHETP